MAADPIAELPALLAAAHAVLDDAAPRFVQGVGGPSAVIKGRNDFAVSARSARPDLLPNEG
ncbi:hypothetical protein [Nocardia arizonensis]|uniref:hypothetical protein n=1 Tax=Nocardia arizonensis TaxID=1141647 RepID=UPI0006CF37C8|nr:hypothetical protein [Nocardia arizonensis]